MGAQYSKTYTDNQITDLEASREDKQAQLSASLAETNRWEKPLTSLRNVSDMEHANIFMW